MSKNADTINLLKTQAKALHKAGQTDLAKQLEAQARVLQKQAKKDETQAIVMHYENGRVYITTPFPPGGRKGLFAYKTQLKEAVQAAGGKAEWDGDRKAWHFKSARNIVTAAKTVLSNFFGGAKILNGKGQSVGFLAESSYQRG